MARGGPGDDSSAVPDEARVLAAQVRARAASAPTEDDIRALGVQAQALTSPGRDMTTEQIRDLTDHAVDQARQVSQLLTRLADLLGDAGSDER